MNLLPRHARIGLTSHFKTFATCNVLNSISHQIGQPSPSTHPHLLKHNELVPGFPPDEFTRRRNNLVDKLLKNETKTTQVVLVPSATVQYMTDKIPYVFRQNTDFRYLTGCLEPDSALMLVIEPGQSSKSILFIREKHSHSELWEGPRTGTELAPIIFGVDEAQPFSKLESELKCLSKEGKITFWYDISNPSHPVVHKSVLSVLKTCGIKDLKPINNQLHELRLIKSPAEQELMFKSAQIASLAIEETMRTTKPGLTEHDVFAKVDYLCRRKGAEHLAYPPVVASGNNANIIHYINNNQLIESNDLVLIDAGCELHGYCSDITRTWPACGKFSPTQETLYEIVLQVQSELIEACSNIENLSLDDLFHMMCTRLGGLLKEAHVLSKEAKSLKLEDVAFKLCPHHVGHYLGMDVHDVGTITRKIPLQPGMVITIEPGVYININTNLTKPEFRGVGIRIEDDILFTESGIKCLSTCPKEVADLEKLFKNEKS